MKQCPHGPGRRSRLLTTVLLAAAVMQIGSVSTGSQADRERPGNKPAAVDSLRVRPLMHAHAHNDYLHPRPLLDALDHGFCSVEADIFLVDGELLVGHSRAELSPERTLQQLYLDPLAERVARNDGRVYRNGPGFTLLVDIKAAGTETFAELNRQLARYPNVFSRHEDGQHHPRAVTVIISGDRDQQAIAAAEPRFAGIDGRLSDLDSDLPADLMPLISDHWGRHFRWNGDGPLSDAEQAKLQRLIQAAHARDRRIRFWAIPDSPAAWSILHDAGVDLINTDDLTGLKTLLSSAETR